jgi:hypothetical protein
MSILKIFFTGFLGAILSSSALAQQQAAPQGGEGANSGVTLDVTPFFTAVDINRDGSISSAEWKTAGLDEKVYLIFDKDKKGSFTRDTLAAMNHPAGIDSNKDGKLSLDEFSAFWKNKKQDSGTSGGAAPAGVHDSAMNK